MESFSAVCSVFGQTSVVEHGGIFTADLTARLCRRVGYFPMETGLHVVLSDQQMMPSLVSNVTPNRFKLIHVGFFLSAVSHELNIS